MWTNQTLQLTAQFLKSYSKFKMVSSLPQEYMWRGSGGGVGVKVTSRSHSISQSQSGLYNFHTHLNSNTYASCFLADFIFMIEEYTSHGPLWGFVISFCLFLIQILPTIWLNIKDLPCNYIHLLLSSFLFIWFFQ